MSHHREGDGVNRSLPFWCFEDDGDLCIILILGLLLLSYDLDNSCYKVKKLLHSDIILTLHIYMLSHPKIVQLNSDAYLHFRSSNYARKRNDILLSCRR